MIKAINYKFNGGTASTTSVTSYDSTKVNLGSLIKIYTGSNPEDKYVSPIRASIARPMEQSTAIPGIYPHVITFSDEIDWVFLFDNAVAAATRRVILYEFNKSISVFNWKGFITLTYPTATNHTIRGGRVSRELYTIGTVSASGVTASGTGTLWVTDRISRGSRIGFGSPTPSLISNWYEIQNIVSNTTITLTTGVTVSAGPYVIEDLQIITANTNATTTNGGLFLAKGLRYELFSPTGTTILAATSSDLVRAVFHLADAATVTNVNASGSALGNFINWSDQRVYVLEGVTTNQRLFVYNFRRPLTVASGRDNGSAIIITGTQSVTGTIVQTNNGRVGTLSHGPGSGIESLYFVTTTRVYRTALSGLTSSSVNWQSDVMVEIPPGGVNTFAATGALTSVEISGSIDRLVVTSSGAAGTRSYVTQYNTNSSQFDHIFLIDTKQIDQSIADSSIVPHASILASAFSVWSEGGLLYLARTGTTAATNMLYTIPIGAHRTYAVGDGQVVITPVFDISDSTEIYNIFVNNIHELGTNDTFSIPTDSYYLYYRTSGISDNSGNWNLIGSSGDLTGVSGTQIQFAIAFKTISLLCIPTRIMGLCLVYEDQNNDSHYEPSLSNSSAATNVFAYRQGTSWGSNIPNLRIRIWNIATGVSVLDDTILLSSFGTWEYSVNNGSSWNAWDDSQDAIGNYIRYSATSLPGGIRVRALLTQA